MYNGLGSDMSNLYRLSNAKSRSICAENFTGEKGKAGMAEEGTGKNCARDLGNGWKISPSVVIKAHSTFCAADIQDSGAIKHIWMTLSDKPNANRFTILRIYWDNEEFPSVECPVGDFFASAYHGYAQVTSLAVCSNPRSAYNCYWEMPFKKACRITVENLDDEDIVLYYQVDYILTEIPEDAGYFHAQFKRTNPLPYKNDYIILDNISGKGQYIGTYLAWGVNNNGWWGEGEIKFFMDGDTDYPTICGTGTEDYFCGSYNFDVNGQYTEFTTPYTGLARVIRPDGLYSASQRFSLYRWHITDPIYFENDLRVTIQALGWRSGGRYLPLKDDIASTAFYYLSVPTRLASALPEKDCLEII